MSILSNEKNWTNNKAPHIYALLFQTLVMSSLGSCFLSALCSGPSSSALKLGSPPSVLPHTPARVIFPEYNLPKSLLCLKIFQWVNKLMDWKASLFPPNPLFIAPHPVLHTPPTLGGWPVQASSVVFISGPSGSWLALASSEHCREMDWGRIKVYLFAQLSLYEVAVGYNSFFVSRFFFLWWGPFLKPLLNLLQYCFCFMFWLLGREACRILVPSPGIEPASPCMGRWSLNHWTAREVLCNSWAKALVSIHQPFTRSPCLPLPHLASMAQADNVDCRALYQPWGFPVPCLIWVECV